MSDRDKGLINAVRKVFPDIPHSKCLHHLSENFKKKYGRQNADILQQMARSYNAEDYQMLLKGIEYNSITKGKSENTNNIVTTGSTENCESEKWNTEVENDKKVSFDNVTNVG